MLFQPSLLVISLACLSVFSCRTGSFQASGLPARQLCFGEGGGFTGAVQEYVLLENGQLFFREGIDAPLLEIKAVRRSRARAFFSELEKMNFAGITLDDPGNRYRFIEWRDQGFRHRLTWGGKSSEPEPAVLGLYQQLLALVPK